jgi:peptide/histidine transporter 3/4
MAGMLTTIVGFFVGGVGDGHITIAIVGMICIGSGLICLICVGGDASWIREGAEQSIYVRSEYTRNDVDDAYQVARLLPYLALITMFWACYGQMNNNFVIQGCQMDLRHWFGGKQVSSAFLSLFDSLVIMIFIPIFDFCIYPMIEKCRGGKPLTVLQKVGAGFVFCCLSMGLAGWIEVLRKQSPVIFVSPECATNATYDATCLDNSECAPVGQIQNMHEISIWWQSAQYTLIGIGEILTSISSYELFYSQVPASMRSVCQGLNLLTTSVGFMVTGGINSVFSFWIPDDLDKGHLEYVYWIVAMLTAINLAAFVHVSQSFEYTIIFSEEASEVESNQENGDGGGAKSGSGSSEDENPNNQESSLSPNWTRHPSRSKWRREQLKERAKSMFY